MAGLEWRLLSTNYIPSDYSSGIHLSGMWEVEQHTPTDMIVAGLRLEEGGYPTIPFDSLTLTNIDGSEKIDNLGEIVDAGGWDLLEQLFYAGEPVSEASTAQVLVSATNESQASNVSKQQSRKTSMVMEQLVLMRLVQAKEITDLTQGVKSASSPTVDGQDEKIV